MNNSTKAQGAAGKRGKASAAVLTPSKKELQAKVSADFVINNLAEAVLYPNPYRGAGSVPSWGVKELKKACIAAKDGVIVWVGPAEGLNEHVRVLPNAKVLDGTGLTAVPGFVDSHTHLLYCSERADEFEMRVRGKTYLEILAAGGGILKTTNAIKSSSQKELFNETLKRLKYAAASGITTIEIKSGYGLDLKNEIKMLKVIQALQKELPIRIVPTFMGAHAIPADRLNDADSFVDEICSEWLPEVAKSGLAVFNDVFTEQKAFSVEQSRKILESGLKHGLKAKIHADEINVLGGVDLAVELGAVSADHLLKTNSAGIKKLENSGVIPTLLPGTSAYLMESCHAPARQMIEAGLPVAIASDHNPGSCQFLNAPLIQTLAMLQLRLSAAEALIAATLHSAYALGLGGETGSIEVGKRNDLALFDAKSYKEIAYGAGTKQPVMTVCNSVPIEFQRGLKIMP